MCRVSAGVRVCVVCGVCVVAGRLAAAGQGVLGCSSVCVASKHPFTFMCGGSNAAAASRADVRCERVPLSLIMLTAALLLPRVLLV